MNLEELLLAKLFAEQAVREGLADVNTMRFEEVSHIPAASEAEANVIYLYRNGDTGFYDMYVLINGAVKRLDDTTVDLSSYAKKDEIPTKTSQLINDSDFLTENMVAVSLLEHMSLADYQKIMNGEDSEGSLVSLFDEITQVANSGKIPVLLATDPYGRPLLLSINNFSFNTSGEIVNQIGISLFTNAMDEPREWFLYTWNLERNGMVSRKKIKPEDESQIYFDVYQSEDGNEVTYDFSLTQIEGLLEEGKQVYLRLYPMGAPIYITLEICGKAELQGIRALLFASSLKINNNSMGFVVAFVQEDNITIDMAPYQIGDRITDVYLTGNELVIQTTGDSHSVEIPILEGPEGPEGPPGMDGNDGRGISNIYFEGTELNFEMDDGEVINAGSLPGVDIEYPIAEPVADATGEAPTAAEFNALLASLRAAGILAE